MRKFWVFALLALTSLILADATPTTEGGSGAGGGFLGFIIGIVAFLIVQFLKPEWFIGWLINLIKNKFERKTANKLTNALGIKFVETGITALKAISDEDNPTIREGISKIEEGVGLVKKEFKLSE